MKITRFHWNVIVLGVIVITASVIFSIFWYVLEKNQQRIEVCTIRTVDRYLDERYGDKRPGLDTRIIADVNKEARSDCSR